MENSHIIHMFRDITLFLNVHKYLVQNRTIIFGETYLENISGETYFREKAKYKKS